MEGYKEQMYSFWDDENARLTGEVLATEIRQVRSAMDRTKDLLIFYQSAIDKLGGANIGVTSLIQDALGILGGKS
jgi:hypothetical protein